MKKILAVLIAMMLLMNMAVCLVSAAHVAEIDDLSVVYNGEENSFLVSGKITGADRDRIPMALHMYYMDNGTEISLAGESTLALNTAENGMVFEFPKVFMSPVTESCDILIDVLASHIDAKESATYTYYGVDDKVKALKAVFAAANISDLRNTLVTYEKALAIDSKLITDLSDATGSWVGSENIALENMLGFKVEPPDPYADDVLSGFDDEEDCYEIAEQVSALQAHYKGATTLGAFFDITSNEELKAWYNDYKSEKAYDDLTFTYESKIDEDYFDEAIGKAGYLNRIRNISNVRTIEELNEAMKIQAILQVIESSTQSAVEDVINDFPSLLTGLTGWSGLTTAQKSTVSVAIAGHVYDSMASLVTELNNAIVSAQSGGDIYVSAPSGSGGGRKDKGDNQVVILPDGNTTVNNSVMAFEDIAHVSWAKNAISYLYTKNIIAGRDNLTFDPDSNVTRAELAKMLVAAFELKGEGKSFNDVSNSAWYAEYVKAAAANGLILGDDNGNFKPNKAISRQDAAVMMYRVLGSEKASEKSYFVDYSSISDYAKDAVDYMCEMEIINGVGNGKFAPKANLTRAQAAKMIYGVLINK